VRASRVHVYLMSCIMLIASAALTCLLLAGPAGCVSVRYNKVWLGGWVVHGWWWWWWVVIVIVITI
jgi:hypothetical protein